MTVPSIGPRAGAKWAQRFFDRRLRCQSPNRITRFYFDCSPWERKYAVI